MTNEILENLDYADDGGALLYKGVRYLLIRPETISEIQKALIEEIGAEHEYFEKGFVYEKQAQNQ